MNIFKKVLLSIFSFLIAIIFIITIIFMINNKKGIATYIFDYSSYMVKGNSMYPYLQAGDLIIIKKCDIYKNGDVITFLNYDNTIVTHRIIDIKNSSYKTEGDNNFFEDSEYTPYKNVYGKLVLKIPKVGKILNFIVDYKYCFIGLVIGLFGLLVVLESRRKNVRRGNN